MKSIRKIKTTALFAAALILIAVIAAGCNFHSSKNVTFSVETGDSINIKLDTTGGYDLTMDVPFTISLNGQELSKGTFIYSSAYEQYALAVEVDEKAELLDSGTKDGCEYIFWKYNDGEYYYAIDINGSDTAIMLMSTVSREAAEDCFGRLSFALV